MPDNIEPTPSDGLETMDTASLPDIADITAECLQLTDEPTFDATDGEVDVHIRLSGDRSYKHTPIRRLFHDYRSNADAYKHLADMPAEGETLHGIISGKYALWELVPALIERAGAIDTLTLATLSFSKQNAAELLGLLDTGHVQNVGLLISYFFKAQNRHLYNSLVPQLIERGHRVLAMRTHCKIILAKMVDGRCFTVESSANLRSSVNIEQFCLTAGSYLYNFHRLWIEGELLHGKELGEPKAKT